MHCIELFTDAVSDPGATKDDAEAGAAHQELHQTVFADPKLPFNYYGASINVSHL